MKYAWAVVVYPFSAPSQSDYTKPIFFNKDDQVLTASLFPHHVIVIDKHKLARRVVIDKAYAECHISFIRVGEHYQFFEIKGEN